MGSEMCIRDRPRKTENYRAQQRCDNQLSTAAPRDSSTLRWTPRANALAKCTFRYQEPSTPPVQVVSRRRKRKLDRPRVLQKAHQIYPLLGRARADLRKPPHHKPSSRLHQQWAPLVSTVAMPFCAKNAAVFMRHKSLAVVPRKFLLCSTQSHPAVQAVGLGAGSECLPSSAISRI